MPSKNLVILISNLTHDPETITAPAGMIITTFNIAVNRISTAPDREEIKEVDFYKTTTYNKLAEIFNTYLKKGRKIYIKGHLTVNKFTTKEGQPAKRIEIVAEKLLMLDSPKESAPEDIPTDINPADIANSIEPAEAFTMPSLCTSNFTKLPTDQ
jgi:single-strand DNA-binding protein